MILSAPPTTIWRSRVKVSGVVTPSPVGVAMLWLKYPGPPTPNEHPTQFAQTFGTINFKYGETAVNAFVQDDFRIAEVALRIQSRRVLEQQESLGDFNLRTPETHVAPHRGLFALETVFGD